MNKYKSNRRTRNTTNKRKTQKANYQKRHSRYHRKKGGTRKRSLKGRLTRHLTKQPTKQWNKMRLLANKKTRTRNSKLLKEYMEKSSDPTFKTYERLVAQTLTIPKSKGNYIYTGNLEKIKHMRKTLTLYNTITRDT